MDTSETYIKMCDCEEIQEQRPQIMMNSTPHYINGKYSHEIDSNGEYRYWPPNGKRIWLPTQDRLQKMVETRPHQYHMKFYDFGITLYKDEDEMDGALMAIEVFTSREQLWLAFVMKEKYGKVWDGEKWSA